MTLLAVARDAGCERVSTGARVIRSNSRNAVAGEGGPWQLKDLPARDIRMLYWEWGIPLTEKSRMQNLVMGRLWLDPVYADKSEQLMVMVETLPSASASSTRTRFSTAAQPLNFSHAMSNKAAAQSSVRRCKSCES